LVELEGNSKLEWETRTSNGNAPIPSNEIYKVKQVVSKLLSPSRNQSDQSTPYASPRSPVLSKGRGSRMLQQKSQ
jgi:hypothetical protein